MNKKLEVEKAHKPAQKSLKRPTKARRSKHPLLNSLATTAIAAETYLGLVRPWLLHWGAAPEEVAGGLPGDHLVDSPRYIATRAITIKAPASQVWPWLVQMGQGKGGLYSYTWLENLIGCDIHNASRIVPEFQDLKVGDAVRLAPPPTSEGGVDFAFTVVELEPEQTLVLSTPGSTEENSQGGLPFASWAFILQPYGPTTTRLIVRYRSTYRFSLVNFLANQALLEPVHFIMERKMLLGIRKRAEKSATDAASFVSTKPELTGLESEEKVVAY